jgi:hypothetical protein
MNQLMTLEVYKFGKMWAFDDEARGLLREPFIAGMDKILDAIAKKLKARRISVTFSGSKFPGFNYTLNKAASESGGVWYICEELGMKGWLCPAMFKYFTTAPGRIYIKAEAA